MYFIIPLAGVKNTITKELAFGLRSTPLISNLWET